MKLIIQDACKTYEGQAVLTHFSMTFPERGTVCLFGPSGCGKTTLLNCIAGLEKLDSGSIFGTEGCKLAYMFQEDRLLPWISARENVETVLRRPDAAVAQKWLEAVGLGGDAEKRPAELSGGMRQRVALARALAYGGELFLLDEPFRALDRETRLRMELLVRSHTQGALKLLVTHDLEEARCLADQVIYLGGPPLRILRVEVPAKEGRNA